jgi:hypothetical protein
MNIANVYRNLDDPKQALRAASSDENAGVIAFEQPNGGVDLSGSKANLPWNLAIEPQGKSVRITVTKTPPGWLSRQHRFPDHLDVRGDRRGALTDVYISRRKG